MTGYELLLNLTLSVTLLSSRSSSSSPSSVLVPFELISDPDADLLPLLAISLRGMSSSKVSLESRFLNSLFLCFTLAFMRSALSDSVAAVFLEAD